MTRPDPSDAAARGAFLDTILNLSHYHREHELFYSRAPLEVAARLQTASRALKALALRWHDRPRGHAVSAPSGGGPGRYRGCEDLNDPIATETLGILFMEGEGEPAEIGKLKADLRAMATEHERGGRWLDEAMTGSWDAADALARIAPLAGSLGDRHRIIVNNWQMATHSTLISRLLERATRLLGSVELTPAALRNDLDGSQTAPALVLSTAELLDQAADLSAQSALLVHDSEPRWRRFRARVQRLAADHKQGASNDADHPDPQR
ncbi:MAG: hypothetical protein P8Y13_00720 [Deinococcales bacterium]